MSYKKDISVVHDEDTTLPRNVGIRSSISAALSSLTSLQAFQNSWRLDKLLHVISDVQIGNTWSAGTWTQELLSTKTGVLVT